MRWSFLHGRCVNTNASLQLRGACSSARCRDRLALDDATEENRNRFRLRRLSPHADYELRIDTWRVFYRVQDDVVIVELIGRKKGNVLLIDGKEFEL